MHKFCKHLIAGVSALVMCLSAVPLSASAEITSTSTSVQQVSNQSVYNQVLALGFDEDEAQYIVDHVDADEILSILGTGDSSINVSRSTSSIDYSLEHATYSNVSSWNTDGSCGSVASAIFLVYLSCYHIPEITYSSPYNLYLALKPYIETNARSSSMSSLESGLIRYLNEHDDDDLNLGSCIKSIIDGTNTTQFKKMCLITIAQLDDDHPVIVGGKYSSSSSSGHVVVIEGIDIVNNSDGSINTANTYIYVNDGWGGTNQRINFKDFVSYTYEGIVYMF